MRLERKLRAWVQAGLVDEATADRIQVYERGRRGPTVLYALIGLGALAIGVGIIAIVAANWADIPAVAKLTIDLLLAMALAVSITQTWRRGLRWPSEGLVIIYYVFVLASIGLVGQIYQTGTPLEHALLFWSAITAPLMLLAKSGFGGALWLAGLGTTYVTNAVELVQRGPESVDLALVLGFGGPLLFLSISAIPWLKRHRPEVSRVFERVSTVLVVGSAFTMSFVWYQPVEGDMVATWGAAACAALGALFATAAPRVSGLTDARRSLAVRVAFVVYTAAWVLPVLVPRESLDLVGAILGVVILAVYAWVGVVFESGQAFNALTLAIAIRIVAIYFEVFGTLMSTGLGLVSGGVVVLLAAWLWWRVSARIRASLSVEGAPDGT